MGKMKDDYIIRHAPEYIEDLFSAYKQGFRDAVWTGSQIAHMGRMRNYFESFLRDFKLKSVRNPRSELRE